MKFRLLGSRALATALPLLLSYAAACAAEAPRPGPDVLATPARWPAGDAGETAGRVGGELRLTQTETAVLAALIAQQGRVLSRRQLLAAAGRPAAGDRAADVVIAQLRAKMGDAGTIRTVRGVGYAIDH